MYAFGQKHRKKATLFQGQMIMCTCSKGLCYQGTMLVIPMSPAPPLFLSPPEDWKGLQLVSTCSFPLLQKVLLSSEQQSWKYSLSRKIVSSWQTDASKFLLEQSLRLHLWIIYLLNLPLKCKWNKLTLVQFGSVEFVRHVRRLSTTNWIANYVASKKSLAS